MNSPRHVCTLRPIQVNKAASSSHLIPCFLVLNARSIVKPDAFPALCADIMSNNIDICCISETWLKPTIPNSLICPPNFSIIRKDRTDRRGGGIAILCRNDWRMSRMVKSLVRSDHDMVITYPRDTVKAKRTNSYFRDVRDHRKLAMLRELESLDWNMITSNIQNLDEMTLKFYETVWPKFDKCFPLIKVRMSSRDPPFMSPLVKHLLKQRKKGIQRGNTKASLRLIDQINKLIRDNQLNAVKQEIDSQKTGSKRWWSNVNSITSRKKQKTYP